MKFIDKLHEVTFNLICKRMRYLDCYSLPVAYILSLDRVLRDHIDDIFDFDENLIKLEALHKGFQTGTSMKTTRLLFNLWNGCSTDGQIYHDTFDNEEFLPSSCFSVGFIFCCDYAPYYWEAIKLRYPEYTVESI